MSESKKQRAMRLRVEEVASRLTSVPILSVPPRSESPEDAAIARAIIAQRRWASTIPPRFRAASLSDLAEPLRQIVLGWAVASGPPNLVLTGPVGAGKTYAACAACRSKVEAGNTLEFWPVVRLLDHLRPGRDEGDPYNQVVESDLLILDDLGAERASEWTAERLYAIVNDRWLTERTTIATTNLNPPQLISAVGERLASRLLGGATTARISGHDRRINL